MHALKFIIFSRSATNTETVCEGGVVRDLLRILQWEGLDGHAQLSVVMCLSMITEDRGDLSQIHNYCVCIYVYMEGERELRYLYTN